MLNLRGYINQYQIDINIQGASGLIPIHITEPPELRYNAENFDCENFFFPSNVKLSFYCKENVFNLLSNDTSIVITKNSVNIYQGKLDYETIQFEPYNNEYQLTFIDVSSLWAKKSYLEFERYISNDDVTDLLSMLNYITGLELVYNFPQNFVTLETQQLFFGQPYVAGIDKWATYPTYFFDGNYPTAMDVIKAMLNSVGLLGYVQGNKFILCNKFTFANSVIIDENKILDMELSRTEAYDYIISSVRISSNSRYNYVYDYRIDNRLEPKKQIKIDHELLVGTQPDNPNLSWSNVWIWVPGYISGGNGGYYIANYNRATFGNGVYKSLWRLLSDQMASQLNNRRFRLKMKYYGSINLFDKINYKGMNFIVTSVSYELGSDVSQITALSI